MSNYKIVDTTSEEFERVRRNNPLVHNLFEHFQRQEVTAEEAFATLAVMMNDHVEHLAKQLKITLDQSPRLFVNLDRMMNGGAE